MLIMHPGLGITRVRFNGYNLSPRTASTTEKFDGKGSDCPGQYQIYLSRPVQARIIKCRKGGYKPKIAYFCTFKFF